MALSCFPAWRLRIGAPTIVLNFSCQPTRPLPGITICCLPIFRIRASSKCAQAAREFAHGEYAQALQKGDQAQRCRRLHQWELRALRPRRGGGPLTILLLLLTNFATANSLPENVF